MSKKAFMDIVRQIGMEGDPCLTVSPSSDCPGFVMLEALEPKAKEWFGNVCLSMDSSMARKLGKALIDCANELEVQS